ncbi:MAG: PAS domain S-box protein [Methanobacterium sp.]
MQAKILIVEDEAITAMDIKRTLEFLGFEVIFTASRGEEAVKKAEELKPDLILMDITIKGEIDGIETAEIIKEQFDIPVIYLTAHSDKSTYERAKLTEPYGFITKPINPEGLNGSIETALYKHKLDQKLAESEIKFRSLFSSIIEGVAIYESIHDSYNKIVDFIVLDVNPAYESILGIKRSEVIGQKVTILHGSNKLPYMETFIKVAESRQPESFESYLESIDKYFDITVTSIENGKFATFFQDITESKRAEEKKQEVLEEVQQFAEELEVSNEELQAITEELQVVNEELRQQGDELIKLNYDLRESEERFRSFYELPLIGIAITSPEKGWIQANDKICDILGYSHEELYNISWDEITYPDDLDKDLEQFNRVLNGYIDGYNIEKRFIRKDGSVVFTYISVGCIRNEDNSVKYFVVLIDDISEIKKVEEGLNESEHKYHTLFDNAGDGILIMKKDRFIDCNSKAMEIYGATKEEIMGKTPYDIFSPEYQDQQLSKEKTLKYIDKALKREQQLFDWEHKSLDGVILNTEVSLNRLKIGSEYYLMAIIRDVTERLKAAKTIKEQLSFLEDLMNTIPYPIFYKDKNYVYLGCNNAFEEYIGLSKDEIIGKTIYDIAPKDIADKYYKKDQELFENLKLQVYEGEVYHINGSKREVLFNKATYTNIEGDVTGLIGVMVDITDLKKAHEALQESETYYKTIFENTGTATIIIEEDKTISLVNSEFEKLYGYSKEEIEGKIKWTDFVADEDDLKRMKGYHEVRGIDPNSVPRNYEFKFINKRKEVRDIFITVALILGTNKRLVSLLDITDKKRSRKALRESKARLKIAMDMAKLVSWEYDFESDMFTFDDQFYALYGTSVEKEGRTKMSSEEYATRFIPPEESYLVAEEINKAMKTDDPNFFRQIEHSIIRADGEKRFMLVRLGIIKDNKGNTIKTYGANQDITESKKAEEKIKASLKEKELLLKEVHHRVKNNMQIISSLLNLQSDYIDDENAINSFKESQERIRSISLVHETLYLSDNLSSIDFEEYIIKMLMGLISNYNAQMIEVNYNIENIQLNIETAIPCGLIINELVTNSIKHAFPHNKGLITVEFTHESYNLKLIIRDNGIGIPDQLINGNSNTLGLRLVKTLADQLDAKLEINNSNGTTFIFIFKELHYKKRV